MTVPRWFLIRLMVGGAAALAPYVTIEIDGIRHAVGTGADPRATNFLVQMPVDLCKSRREREFFHAKMYALHRAAGDGDAAQVEALLEAFVEEVHPPGHVVVPAGSSDEVLCVIKRGEAIITSKALAERGEERMLSPAELFGEHAALQKKHKRATSVVAHGRGSLVLLTALAAGRKKPGSPVPSLRASPATLRPRKPAAP